MLREDLVLLSKNSREILLTI